MGDGDLESRFPAGFLPGADIDRTVQVAYHSFQHVLSFYFQAGRQALPPAVAACPLSGCPCPADTIFISI